MRGISKRFGQTKVLDSLDCALHAGQCALLLGHNGSGKSTLLRICAGLLRPDSGTISRNAPIESGAIAYLGHRSMLYSALSVEENLALAYRLRGLDAELAPILQRWNLERERQQIVATLSKGQQTRAALARVLIDNPRFIFLDEPTASLDEASVEILTFQLRAQVSSPEPATVLIATHDIRRLEHLAQRVIVLFRGKVEHDSHAQDAHAIPRAIERYQELNR
jgi:heme ABC exporter ATP-binding subunit CcmA